MTGDTRTLAEWLTAERERGIRRQHHRLHPNGYVGQRVCDVCLLLARLTFERAAANADTKETS